MIKWNGKDTSGRLKWNATADTFKELYGKLVNKGIISTSDYDPYEKEVMEKAGMVEDEILSMNSVKKSMNCLSIHAMETRIIRKRRLFKEGMKD